jgi:hypothetical protein
MASQLAILVAIYFASVELSATKVYFLLNHVIIVDPKLKKHPEVLFLSMELPAQSKSVYPCSIIPSPPRYLRPYSIVPLEYLSTCFTPMPLPQLHHELAQGVHSKTYILPGVNQIH